MRYTQVAPSARSAPHRPAGRMRVHSMHRFEPLRRPRTATAMAAEPTRPETVRIRKVACPKCGTTVEWSTSNRFRPFCSERCRLIDLGAWASEDYRVPDVVKPMDESGE
jgi:endogenous inhibitor of DNA gyrase (YacG/DUF329 family)